MAQTFILRLLDGVETVEFVDDPTSSFFLEDSTLNMAPPDIEEYRVERRGSQRSLVAADLREREIEFDIQVRGSSWSVVAANLNKLARMFGRALNEKAMGGAGFGGIPGYDSADVDFQGVNTGDHGLRLEMRFGSAGVGTIINEVGETVTETRIYVFKVLRGELEQEGVFGLENTNMIGSAYMTKVHVLLICDPLALGQPRIIATATNLYTEIWPDGGAGSTDTNRIVIPAASIPGSHEALTRITTHMLGSGIIIGRDAGRSLLNSPSCAKVASVYDQVYVIPYGYGGTATPKQYEVNLVSKDGGGVPTVRWRTNGGSWSGNTALSAAYDVHWVDGTSVGFYTSTNNWTSVANGTTYVFRNHQASFYKQYVFNAYSFRSAFMSVAGYTTANLDVMVNVPPGIFGRYKILAGMIATGAELANGIAFQDAFWEVRAKIRAVSPTLNTIIGEGAWVRSWGSQIVTADLGVLDLTPQGSRGIIHPFSTVRYLISMYFRGIDYPGSDAAITIHSINLIPCSDDYAYLRSGWAQDMSGAEIYSNFDANASYIAEMSNDFRGTSPDNPYTAIVPLDETHEGNVITLVPNVENTIVFMPLWGMSPDYRAQYVTSLNTGRVEVAIRPRSIFVG